MRPIVVTIAGSDPSAGAGIQADLKAIEANGAYGATVISALTVQNTCGVRAVEALDPALVGAQLDALLDDLSVAAVKTGMLANAAIVHAVATRLRAHGPIPLVCDPLLASHDGAGLLDAAAIDTLRAELFPLATLITPNAREAGLLAGMPVDDGPSAERAAQALFHSGTAAVLVKGGHLERERATDFLVTPAGCTRLPGEWIETRHTHGTGCVYASAVAAGLARGVELVEAVRAAKRFVSEAIRHGLDLGRGEGPTDPLYVLHRAALRTAPVGLNGDPE